MIQLGMVVFVVLGLLAPAAESELLELDWSGAGDRAITRDTATGLDWLDLTASVGRSYNDVSANLDAGGDFAGFRHASFDEVFGLLTSVGWPVISSNLFSPDAYQPLSNLQGLVGITEDLGYMRISTGTTADIVSGVRDGVAIYVSVATLSGLTQRGGGWDDDEAWDTVGHWLVRPLPTASDLVIDFGGIGLWARMNDSSWLQLNNASPDLVAAGDVDGNGADDVIAYFSSFGGLFVKRNLGGWSQFSTLAPEAMTVGDLDANGRDDVVIDFGAIGLWARMNDASWLKLHNSSPELIATGDLDGNGADDVLATFTGLGLWQKLNLGGWSKLSNSAPDAVVSGDVNGSGRDDVTADFGSTLGGIYVKRDQGAWLKLHNSSPDSMTTGSLDGQ